MYFPYFKNQYLTGKVQVVSIPLSSLQCCNKHPCTYSLAQVCTGNYPFVHHTLLIFGLGLVCVISLFDREMLWLNFSSIFCCLERPSPL